VKIEVGTELAAYSHEAAFRALTNDAGLCTLVVDNPRRSCVFLHVAHGDKKVVQRLPASAFGG
jgi:hypothetical protein